MQLYNIIILLILINVIINYKFGINLSILNCGIFAWVGKDTKHFRKDLFNILGMYNDNRGGDSCGVYLDNGWYKGIGDTAKYERLIPKYDLHNVLKPKVYPIVIGHDRKTSVGATTLENTQPIVLLNNEEESVFVHAHNGTISNYSYLAEKHKVTIDSKDSDSVAMAKLISAVGFDILGEYEGSGAFVMYFKNEPNTLYAFHGKSKLTEYAQIPSEERPLAYITFPGKGTYISSDINHLGNISCPGKDIKAIEFDYNVLYRLEGDVVEKVRDIDRTKIAPSKKVIVYDNRGSSYNTRKSPLIFESTLRNKCIRYNKGIYVYGTDNKYAHGVYLVDPWGQTVSDKNGKHKTYELCFIYGILMRNREYYELLKHTLEENNITTSFDFYRRDNWLKHNIQVTLREYALYPFWRYDTVDAFLGYIKPDCWPIRFGWGQSPYFDGSFRPLFSNFEFKTNSGDIISANIQKSFYSIRDFIDDHDVNTKEYYIEVTSEEELQEILKDIVNEENDKNNIIRFPAQVEKNSNLNSRPTSCDQCDVWRYNSDYCVTMCQEDVIYNKNHQNAADAYNRAYQYVDVGEDESDNMAKEVIFDAFKDLYKAMSEFSDTYSALSVNIKDPEISEIVEDINKIQSKLLKY